MCHIQNKHSWTTGDLLSKCEHPRLTKKQIKSKEWLSPNSDTFMILQDIITSKTVLNDLKHLRQFSQTGTLDIYQALYNKWTPKFYHFVIIIIIIIIIIIFIIIFLIVFIIIFVIIFIIIFIKFSV